MYPDGFFGLEMFLQPDFPRHVVSMRPAFFIKKEYDLI